MALHKPALRTADGQRLPSKLKLAFSKAADNKRINAMFKPAVKSKTDPHNFVVKREKDVFDKTVGSGSAAFLYDTETGEAYTLTMAYHVEKNGNHTYTEIGTSLTRITGFKSAQIVVAALILKEWWDHNPSDMIVTEIIPENKPSLHLYKNNLYWNPLTDRNKTAELHRLCNESISKEDKDRQTTWFFCPESLMPKMARILLDYMDSGALSNRHTKQDIELDLSALKNIGMTRKTLETIAKGVVDKNGLKRQGRCARHSPTI